MPSIIDIEELKILFNEIKDVKQKHPEASKDIALLIKKRKMWGYKNFCRMFTEEWTPEELKTGKKGKKIDNNDSLDAVIDKFVK